MADILKKSSQVVFTWNEGQSWFDFTVGSTPFEVDNILIEPNTTATTFLMYGTRDGGEGVVYYMEFDALHFPACQGVWAADSVSSDYETWTPSDGVNKENCILGQQITYTRRKRTSQCFNTVQFERPVVKKTCECTKEDFICDIGFTRAVGSVDCAYGGADMMPERFVPAVCRMTWSADAYRKVSGDVCEGGFLPAQVDVPCPSFFTGRSSSKWNLLAVVVVVGLIIWNKNRGGNNVKGGPGGSGLSTALLEYLAAFLGFLSSKLSTASRGFDSHYGVGYKAVGKDEFEESLTDFVDEDDDDVAPRVYSNADDRPVASAAAEVHKESARIVPGQARTATEAVPRLSGPPGGASGQQNVTMHRLDANDDDDDVDLL